MMNKRLKSFPGFIAVLIFLFAWGVMAQERFELKDIKVVVDGETTITEKYVLDHIRLKRGDVFVRKGEDQNLENLILTVVFGNLKNIVEVMEQMVGI